MSIPVEPGAVLHGFCNGFFGRDSYEDRIVEAVGKDWIVARGVDSKEPMLAYFGPGYSEFALRQLFAVWLGDVNWDTLA